MPLAATGNPICFLRFLGLVLGVLARLGELLVRRGLGVLHAALGLGARLLAGVADGLRRLAHVAADLVNARRVARGGLRVVAGLGQRLVRLARVTLDLGFCI